MVCAECGDTMQIGDEYRNILGDPVHERCVRIGILETSAKKEIWEYQNDQQYIEQRYIYEN